MQDNLPEISALIDEYLAIDGLTQQQHLDVEAVVEMSTDLKGYDPEPTHWRSIICDAILEFTKSGRQ